jgi:hypothetical protein
MTALSIQPPYPIFTDTDGQPLENGYVWIGTANQNPITNPVAVFWDAALTQPAAQPIRTLNGYPANAGTPARLYVNSDYSIQVQNKNGTVVYSAPGATERLSDVVVTGVDSSEVTFLQAGTGAVQRTAQAKMRETVSVKDFGAVGDGVADDTVAIQAAINRAVAIRGTVFIPPAHAGSYYKITAPLAVSAPVSILGDNTFGSLLFGVGMSAGAYILDFNCLAANNVELIHISGLTIRSADGVPNALRLKNVANVVLKEVRLYGVTTGITIEGSRCYTHAYEQVVGYQISDATIRFAGGFTGGGQFSFDGCTFTTGSAAGAFVLPSTALADNLSFVGCNWEQCVGVGVFIAGTCTGISFVGCRTEGGDTTDFQFVPNGASEYVGGINISGCVFSASDAAAANRIVLGGGSGTVRGFSVTGNYVTHGSDSYAGKLVQLNGDGESGLIAGNMVRGTTAAGAGVVNTQRAGVVVFSNENLTGKLPEHWGLFSWVVSQTSYTATATGMTTSPTGTVKYSVVGNTVTLDIPSISGTSNSTSFTLTGGPVAIRPAVDKDIFLRITDNGTNAVGFARIKTTGVIELYATVAGVAFTASGTKAVTANSISYTLA